MKKLLQVALEEAQNHGATYADVRVVERASEPVGTKNGKIMTVSRTEDKGFGVRVLADGAWGFASCSRLNEEELRQTARRAVAIAKASARVQKQPVELSPIEPVEDIYITPFEKDPFDVKLEDKISFLQEIDKLLRSQEEIRVATTFMNAYRQHKVFMSTEGSYIEQKLLETGASVSATAAGSGDVQRRSFSDYITGGYEYIDELNLYEKAPQLAEEAVQLLTADSCPRLETDLILGSSQLALQIHESCGHPIELDRVYGTEASFAGTSFLTTDKKGSFQYGSEVVNIFADATAPRGLGTFGYDDEGVPAQRTQIVKDGLFVDYLTSRETAPTLGQKSNGTMLADGWSNIPLVRMTNINLEPGDWSLDEIIKDTKYGIFMDSSKSWSLDDKRLNFHFGCEIAYEVKDGELGRMLKNPAYYDMTPHFWNACDAIAGRDEWHIWGLPSCAKGEPVQIAHVGHGAAPARFRNIKVGVE